MQQAAVDANVAPNDGSAGALPKGINPGGRRARRYGVRWTGRQPPVRIPLVAARGLGNTFILV